MPNKNKECSDISDGKWEYLPGSQKKSEPSKKPTVVINPRFVGENGSGDRKPSRGIFSDILGRLFESKSEETSFVENNGQPLVDIGGSEPDSVDYGSRLLTPEEMGQKGILTKRGRAIYQAEMNKRFGSGSLTFDKEGKPTTLEKKHKRKGIFGGSSREQTSYQIGHPEDTSSFIRQVKWQEELCANEDRDDFKIVIDPETGRKLCRRKLEDGTWSQVREITSRDRRY